MLMLKKCARNIKSVRMSKNELFKLIITHPAKIKWGHKRKQANDQAQAQPPEGDRDRSK
jgi:hypothetical protein